MCVRVRFHCSRLGVSQPKSVHTSPAHKPDNTSPADTPTPRHSATLIVDDSTSFLTRTIFIFISYWHCCHLEPSLYFISGHVCHYDSIWTQGSSVSKELYNLRAVSSLPSAGGGFTRYGPSARLHSNLPNPEVKIMEVSTIEYGLRSLHYLLVFIKNSFGGWYW